MIYDEGDSVNDSDEELQNEFELKKSSLDNPIGSTRN